MDDESQLEIKSPVMELNHQRQRSERRVQIRWTGEVVPSGEIESPQLTFVASAHGPRARA